MNSAARTEPVRAPRFGLSAKLLLLTILFVMIAEVLIYVPLVVNFRVNWLNAHLGIAKTARRSMLEAAPHVPTIRWPRRFWVRIGAHAVAMKMGDKHYMLQPSDTSLPPIADVFDMRQISWVTSAVDAFQHHAQRARMR